ncbi:MAG: glycosyl hydrolase family 2 [Muribaculum sp.]|nr:glycosyl hydrolase family 2 [Muribaculaceae bacterium]MCM1080513.1 glycosyl hydrolase family 2 [Muribaculum sp.]
MKNRLLSAILLLIAVAVSVSAQPDALKWPAESPQTRPGTRWWWLGSAVDSMNLSSNINQYAQAGIGAVEITPIYGVQGNDANEIPFLSDAWMCALRQVQAAASSANMLIDMNMGTGWPFGGPEVELSEAACKAVFLVDTVAPGAEAVKILPAKEQPTAKKIAESRRKLSSGNDEIIRLYESRTKQMVKRAAPGGEGLVIDHFDSNAVARYLDKFDHAFSSTSTPYPHTFFNDSYEVYGASWTPALLAEFEKRRGYRLQEKLPELLGLIDDVNLTLSDYRETLGELLLENFTLQWVDWAHRRGVKVRNQAHGSPANLIDLYAAVDIPEIEGFGLSDFGIRGLRSDSGYTRRNDSDVSMLKYASSAAHITGKPLTSSETFTWLTEHFRTSLSQMKPDLDLMYTCGVNNIFFHGTTYSPVDDPWPGWKFYASVDMSPTNSIWRDAPALMRYASRCQSFLQWGKPDNDFLVYLPVRDMWRQRLQPGEAGLLMTFDIHSMRKKAPDFIATIMKIDSLGYDCDYISDRYLATTTVAGKQLVTAAGTRYNALIVPGSGDLTQQLKAHLDSLAEAGATIIYGVDTAKMASAAKAEPIRTLLGLRTIRRSNDNGHHYFIANLTPNDVDSYVPLTVDFADAAWFNPMDGSATLAEIADGKVRVALRSGQSSILRTYPDKLSLPQPARYEKLSEKIDLTNRNWQLTFVESSPSVDRSYSLDSLMPWTALADSTLNRLAGTGVYTTEATINDLSGRWIIELGDVRESARVYINNQLIGTAWSVPFALDCTKALQKGENIIRIEVTNLPANRIAALDRDGVEWRKFKEINIVDINYRKSNYADWTTVASGLNSAVELLHFVE